MNRIRLFLLCALVMVTCAGFSQVYYSADLFPLIGKTTDSTETRYERLPKYLKGEVAREALWALGKNTSGLAIRFRSNSSAIWARWEVFGNRMNHMTDTGIKGLDLYAWEEDGWSFVNSAQPGGKITEKRIISNMTPEEREYMLFLPLYDGIVSLSIGIDSSACIETPRLPYPRRERPVVVYGTSITQGGCASRPGMSYTNILMRRLNREFVNLGFSGNGQLDYEIAGLMATCNEAALFVLDFIPNVNADQIGEKTKTFFDIIRKACPGTPVLFVESIVFPHSRYDVGVRETVAEKNRLLRKEFEALKEAGNRGIYYLEGEGLIGCDGEGTVDGVHLTDLGFLRIAGRLEKCIGEIEGP